MKTLKLGNIEIQFDVKKNTSFYRSQNGFTCDCPFCINYVKEILTVKELLQGLDETLGIDLTKDVGQGMDELMSHDNENHCLYVVPYYINGKCLINGNDLETQSNGPIWPHTIRTEYQLNEKLSLTFINTSESVKFENVESVLTMWVEYKSSFKAK